MLCPKCHSLLTKGAKYCDICGTRISQFLTLEPTSSSSRGYPSRRSRFKG